MRPEDANGGYPAFIQEEVTAPDTAPTNNPELSTLRGLDVLANTAIPTFVPIRQRQ